MGLFELLVRFADPAGIPMQGAISEDCQRDDRENDED
jgi:hypothetical protein